MNTSLQKFTDQSWEKHQSGGTLDDKDAQLVLCFGAKELLALPDIYKKIQQKFSEAQIVFCSTAGEIFHDAVENESIVALAVSFTSSHIHTTSICTDDFTNSYDMALALMKNLPTQGLRYVLLITDGSQVNGSELVKGVNEVIDETILVTGGLAGDAFNFQSTLVGLNEQPAKGKVVAVGFYGNNIFVTHGTRGGWEAFGPKRKVTKSEGKVLYEIDGKKILDIYKKYLGDEANELPASALRYPLAVYVSDSPKPLVRTILSIDEESHSMSFAGDIPEGAEVRFMKSDFDQLTSAASDAAIRSLVNETDKPNFALLISCVGRKLILGKRVVEEVQTINDLFGANTVLAGFYSYGEIAPFNGEKVCQLHNQTMTITSFYEA